MMKKFAEEKERILKKIADAKVVEDFDFTLPDKIESPLLQTLVPEIVWWDDHPEMLNNLVGSITRFLSFDTETEADLKRKANELFNFTKGTQEVWKKATELIRKRPAQKPKKET